MEYLWLIILFPLVGFILLGLSGRRMSPKTVAVIGIGTAVLSAIFAGIVSSAFLTHRPESDVYTQYLLTWIDGGAFKSEIVLRLDPLSLVMVLVVSFVGFLIHLYSAEYMRGDEGYHRFFAYMNLFLGSMLILVLADDLVLLYAGWEGVGLCSYLLIGFWQKNPDNARAARKAFLVTRIGDAAFAIGIFLLWSQFKELRIDALMQDVTRHWAVNSTLAITASALLLGGAVGKSAQLPLQVWLPDAMAGPTPVSALIHAATMVTAGVYLIARTNPLFALSPPVELAVAIIGATTIVVAGVSAVVQLDIKRVLAYSTISQLGYMFLAEGVGAWPAAVYHLTSHAFFKALLFLAAGVVILRVHHQQDMLKMGGLRRRLPLTFMVFLIGCLALAGLPPASGFASKELILDDVWGFPMGGHWFWGAGLLGTFLTSIYTFRMLFLVFGGQPSKSTMQDAGIVMGAPLVILAFLSLGGAALNWLHNWGGVPFFTDFLAGSHPTVNPPPELPELTALIAGLSGIPIGWQLANATRRTKVPATPQTALSLKGFLINGWGFDQLYDVAFVQPFVSLAKFGREDLIDWLYVGISGLAQLLHRALAWTESGRVRWYALGLTVGAVFILGVVLLL